MQNPKVFRVAATIVAYLIVMLELGWELQVSIFRLGVEGTLDLNDQLSRIWVSWWCPNEVYYPNPDVPSGTDLAELSANQPFTEAELAELRDADFSDFYADPERDAFRAELDEFFAGSELGAEDLDDIADRVTRPQWSIEVMQRAPRREPVCIEFEVSQPQVTDGADYIAARPNRATRRAARKNRK